MVWQTPEKAHFVYVNIPEEVDGQAFFVEVCNWASKNIGRLGYVGYALPFGSFFRMKSEIRGGEWVMVRIGILDGPPMKVSVRFAFRKPQDAVMFKLRWGGL